MLRWAQINQTFLSTYQRQMHKSFVFIKVKAHTTSITKHKRRIRLLLNIKLTLLELVLLIIKCNDLVCDSSFDVLLRNNHLITFLSLEIEKKVNSFSYTFFLGIWYYLTCQTGSLCFWVRISQTNKWKLDLCLMSKTATVRSLNPEQSKEYSIGWKSIERIPTSVLYFTSV